jgi:hypothetical protein
LPLTARRGRGESGPATVAQQEPRHRKGRDSEQSDTERTDTDLLVVVNTDFA